MKYLNFVAADARPSQEQLAVMQREIPGWIGETKRRGQRLLGRPLDLPHTAATVRPREGEVLVTDGPFVEAKEFIAGFDLVDCADLDETIELAATAPVSWFMSIEIRPFTAGPWLGEAAFAFGRGEDGAGSPYALTAWTGGTSAPPPSDPAVTRAAGTWRQDLLARGRYLLGGVLAGADSATTLRVRDGQKLISDGTFIKTGEFITSIDVVSCPDRQQAVELAAAHPLARYQAIEVRPFEPGGPPPAS